MKWEQQYYQQGKVEAGTITLGGAETSMAIGTARLDVTDTTVTISQVENFESAAGDYTISSYLDISLLQFTANWYKQLLKD